MEQESIKAASTSYSESKFWEKLKRFAIKAGSKVVYYALLLYYTMLSNNVSFEQKALIVGALGYLISPLDLIPDAIPVIGFSDDLAALYAVYSTMKSNITPVIERQAKMKIQQWFKQIEVESN